MWLYPPREPGRSLGRWCLSWFGGLWAGGSGILVLVVAGEDRGSSSCIGARRLILAGESGWVVGRRLAIGGMGRIVR